MEETLRNFKPDRDEFAGAPRSWSSVSRLPSAVAEYATVGRASSGCGQPQGDRRRHRRIRSQRTLQDDERCRQLYSANLDVEGRQARIAFRWAASLGDYGCWQEQHGKRDRQSPREAWSPARALTPRCACRYRDLRDGSARLMMLATDLHPGYLISLLADELGGASSAFVGLRRVMGDTFIICRHAGGKRFGHLVAILEHQLHLLALQDAAAALV